MKRSKYNKEEEFINRVDKMADAAQTTILNYAKDIDEKKLINSCKVLSEESDEMVLFREQFSSKKKAIVAESEKLNLAFQQRDKDGLMAKLNSRKTKKRGVKYIWIAVSSVSAVAVVAAFLFFNLGDNNQVVNILPELANRKEIVEITKPILISSNNEVFELNNDVNTISSGEIKKILEKKSSSTVATESEKDVIEMQNVIIPSGYTYNIYLSDSTEVMLNAGSSLKFPSRFSGESREVILTGEALFKVRKSDKPFIVNVDDKYIKVYGTTFNINSYDLSNIETVLIEGSVGVGAQNMQEIMVKPNQMATLNTDSNGGITSDVKNINVDDYLGWSEGYFRYVDSSFLKFIRDIAIWYNVEIDFDEAIFDGSEITLSISKTYSFDQLMKVVETIKNVKLIKREGDKYDIIKE